MMNSPLLCCDVSASALAPLSLDELADACRARLAAGEGIDAGRIADPRFGPVGKDGDPGAAVGLVGANGAG